MEKLFAGIFLAFLLVMLILFGVFTEYAPAAPRQGRYPYFQDVNVMIFIGFGFLMSFLNNGSFTAVGHAFLVAVYAAFWGILNRGFWMRAITEHQTDANGVSVWDKKIELGIEQFITADFAAGAVLISFGAMLGRITASQLLAMAIFEIVFYSINEAILVERFYVADIGGSMIIHTFGAYFGLACSFVLEKSNPDRYKIDSSSEGSTRISDTVAMIGTIFLFCFWPSFNGALAGVNVQDRAAVNTLLSIFGSCAAAYFVCVLVDKRGRFGMVELQNSTIAGGVAIGAAADMFVHPVAAMGVGILSGALSVLGYRFITPKLTKVAGLRDTCGVHNLHGLPGILAAIVAAIAAGAGSREKYGATYGDTFLKPDRSRGEQAGYQLAGLALTLAMSIVTGAITGFIIGKMPWLATFFTDVHEYTMPAEGVDHAAEEMKANVEFDQTVGFDQAGLYATESTVYRPHEPAEPVTTDGETVNTN